MYSYLIHFDKPSTMKQDYQETISKKLLTFLHLSCGKEVKVTVANNIQFADQNQLNLITRITIGILAIVTSPLAFLGIFLQRYSETYNQTLKEYMRTTPALSVQATPLPSVQDVSSQVIQKTLNPPKIENDHSILHTPIRNLEKPNPLPLIKSTPIKPFITLKQIYNQLADLIATWNSNVIENQKIPLLLKEGSPERIQELIAHPFLKNPPKEKSERLKSERQLNEQIFAYVKNSTNIKTPADILWSWNRYLSGVGLDYATPIMENGKIIKVEEGCFYRLDSWSDDLINKIEKPQVSYFGSTIQYKDGKIYLYLDGISEHSFLRINDTIYKYKQGFGLSKPAYIFKPGDQCFNQAEYLFRVQDEGKIMLANKKRYSPPISEKAKEQFYNFEKTFATRALPKYPHLTHTVSSAVIPPEIPLEQGFSQSSVNIDFDSKKYTESTPFEIMIQDSGDLTFVDLEKDPILNNILKYFKAEFNLIEYTDQQKLIRLSSFAAIALEEGSLNLSNSNYYLGNILLAGKGVCRHRSLLVKALADQLNIPCALIVGQIPGQPQANRDSSGKIEGFTNFMILGSHVWNAFHDADGKYWILDPMNQTCFQADNPPGHFDVHKKEIQEYYGVDKLNWCKCCRCTSKD